MPLLTTPSPKPGIIAHNPISTPEPTIDLVAPTATYTTPVVDLRWKPLDSLITHVNGSSWVVDYFCQVITKDSDLSGLQATASGVYQQYTRIASLELKVSSPLSTSQDETSVSMSATGSSVVFPVVIPNVGDMFLAEVSPGQLALFQVTRTSKKSLFSQSCYEIEYSLDSTDPIKIDDLASKVVESYYYHATYINHGRNPLVVEKQAQGIVGLHRLYGELIQRYLSCFFSQEYQTLMVPEQGAQMVDTFLTKYFLKVVETGDDSRIPRMLRQNVQSLREHNEVTIFDAIHEQSLFKFNHLSSQFTLLTKHSFDKRPRLAGFRWSAIEYAVWPTSHHYNVDEPVMGALPEPSRWLRAPSSEDIRASWARHSKDLYPAEPPVLDVPEPQDDEYSSLYDMYAWDEPKSLDRYASIYGITLFGSKKKYTFCVNPVSLERHYIFQEDFYKAKPSCIFECLLLDHVKGKPIDADVLYDLGFLSTRWSRLDQFYYTPMLLDMFKRHITLGRS